jgi:hypothetical protein
VTWSHFASSPASRFAENAPLVGEHEYGDRDYDYARARLMLG